MVTIRDDTFEHVLIGDVVAAFESLEQQDSQPLRRAAIRAVFAAIEGLLFAAKEDLLPRAREHPRMFTSAEESILAEESYQVDERGRIQTLPRFVPLERNIRVTLRLLQRIRPNTSVDFSHPGWESLKLGLAVRHRLTHPKRLSELVVSDAEIQAASRGFYWFLAFSIETWRQHVKYLEERASGMLRRATSNNAPPT